MPESFVPWIYWKLGERIAEDYMIPYNQKMFSRELSQLGTYWLEKLPNVSFEETLRSCLEKKAFGTQPGHAQFYYPKRCGYGELWHRMGESLGARLICGCTVTGIDFENVTVFTEHGQYSAERVFVTIPWTGLTVLKGMPDALRDSISKLKHSAVETRYYDETLNTAAHWIYYPDPKLPYHRILVRSNFCSGSRGYWTETNAERLSMFDNEKDGAGFRWLNEYAYPLNTREKPDIMASLLSWTASHGVIGVGRWGEWQHYNSDVTVEKAMSAINNMCD